MAFGDSIKPLRESAGISVQKIADLIGVNADRWRKWESKGLSPRYEDQIIIEKFFGMSLQDVENLNSIKKFLNVPRETQETGNYLKDRRDKKNFIPRKRIDFFEAPSQAGNNYNDEMAPVYASSGTIDVGDLLHDSEAAIRIYGNSMLPNYPPGCVVGLVKVTSSFIQPGEVYVIETREQRLLKRLFYKDDQPDAEKITCVSDNTMTFENGGRHGKAAYPNFDIPKAEIMSLFMVTGVIKRNANSLIMNRREQS